MIECLTVRELADGYKLECDLTDTSIRLDSLGRWSNFRQRQQFFRRCVDGSLVQGKAAIPLDQEKAIQVYGDAKRWLHEVGLRLGGETPPKLQSLIDRAGSYEESDYLALKHLYNEMYPESVPILPPDRYKDVVVQPAIGCPNRRCTFCAFYKDKPFAVIKKTDFEKHIDGIVALFGKPEIKARGGVFIGSANAMALSQRRLLDCLDVIEKKLGVFQRGIAAFADPDFSAPRTLTDWQALASRNIQRVVIGLETGWGKLRARLGKSGDLTKVRKAVNDIKAGGISVGITVLAGACEASDSAKHYEETIKFIESLKLGLADMVYISLLDEGENKCLRGAEERALLLKGLKKITSAKVVPYQMQRFRYFS